LIGALAWQMWPKNSTPVTAAVPTPQPRTAPSPVTIPPAP
jgi:hypothetical protein